MAKIITMNVGIDKTFLKFKFSQEIINNGENVGSKNKRGRLMKNMKSPNSGLIYKSLKSNTLYSYLRSCNVTIYLANYKTMRKQFS